MNGDIERLAQAVLDKLAGAGKRLTTVESCTGGLVSGALTSLPGSSRVFERGFVTYSNEAKNELAGVPLALIGRHGAVSGEVAEAMARGGLRNSNADIAVSITGIAGPGGATPDKPVGLVYIALAVNTGDSVSVEVKRHVFSDANRNEVRAASVQAALQLVLWSPDPLGLPC